MRPVQPSVVAARHHVMLSAVPSSGKVNTMIRITGIGDHDRPEWLIRINGMRIPTATRPLIRPAIRRVMHPPTSRLTSSMARHRPMRQPTRQLGHLTVARTAALLIILGHVRRCRSTRSLTIRVIDTELEHRVTLAVRALLAHGVRQAAAACATLPGLRNKCTASNLIMQSDA